MIWSVSDTSIPAQFTFDLSVIISIISAQFYIPHNDLAPNKRNHFNMKKENEHDTRQDGVHDIFNWGISVCFPIMEFSF